MTAGFSVPQCKCGHALGDHKSGGQTGLHRPQYGVCLIRGCECHEFRERDEDEPRTAA